jgi:sec-independent protein translocase protein TatB
MPSFGDTALIALLALLLFGPKKLPELARQLGKLMGEFRRASNEFRMQMEDELRISEQEEQQKKIAAIETAAPVPPPLEDESFVMDHPDTLPDAEAIDPESTSPMPVTEQPETTGEAVAIASSGEINMMPPATGLPVSRSPLSSVLDSIPQIQTPESAVEPPVRQDAPEASVHG